MGNTTIEEAARAYADGRLDNSGFIAVAPSLPPVKQVPHPDREWWDDWPRVRGPVAGMVAVYSQGLVPAELYDTTIAAMAEAGHEA